MATKCTVFKVFIGSPSDVSEERQYFLDVVAEVNNIYKQSGIQLIPLRWEDALPGRVRAQDRINDDFIRDCDLAVFVLWKRWGSPSGKYSSGFEEEYELASCLSEKTKGRPDILLYFRDISDDLIANPDGQLAKVLDFRKKLNREHIPLYKPYMTPIDWQALFRSHLQQWILKQFALLSKEEQMGTREEIKPAEAKSEPVPIATSRSQWSIVDTPDSIPSLTKELLNPNNQGAGINKIVVACDGKTIWAVVRRGDRNGINQGGAQVMLYRSIDGGISWTDVEYLKLATAQSGIENGTLIWDLAIAPDDPNIVAVACADISVNPLLQQAWISTDNGNTWENTEWPPVGITAGTDLISALDISRAFGDRKILVGTRDGNGIDTNNLQIMKLDGRRQWKIQCVGSTASASVNQLIGDIVAAKFSPNFPSDRTIVVIYCDGTPDHTGTWLATGVHDVEQNSTLWQEYIDHVEIKNANDNLGNSPRVDEIIIVNLELPFDFSGDDTDHRRFYVSTDAIGKSPRITTNRGVYRIDDKVIYTLMDNTHTFGLVNTNNITRRTASIAYFGWCTSGKLLVGEVLGYGNLAAVPTWFTDSPTTYPIPVWYPALKPTTGAAGQAPDVCAGYTSGYGNVRVTWSSDGRLAYAATSAASLGPCIAPATNNGAVNVATAWPAGYVNVIPFDESAFGISRSNGETWNQLSLINTFMSKLADVAPSTDGRTIYLASVNTNAGSQGFDSVWRSSSNADVTSPLPALPIGTCWERVLTRVTAVSYDDMQSDLALLRTVPYGMDPTGQIVAWAAQYTKAQAWSPDFGEYWAIIVPREIIQDFCFESSTVLYNLTPDGLVQKMPYTGTAWETSLPSSNTHIQNAHTIAAYSVGKILIGAARATNLIAYPIAFSLNHGNSWDVISHPLPTKGNVHVAFDPHFQNKSIIYVADDGSTGSNGSIYRQTIPVYRRWVDTDIMNPVNGSHGKYYSAASPYGLGGYYGLQSALSTKDLYSAHGMVGQSSGVCRTRDRYEGVPEPGINWECLKTFTQVNAKGIQFTTEPSSLKCCGGLIIGMKITLYAIDNNCYANNHNASAGFGGIKTARECGMLWAFTDDMAKNP